jgi:hypothetical protein
MATIISPVYAALTLDTRLATFAIVNTQLTPASRCPWLPACAEHDLASFNGSDLPLAKASGEPQASGDIRPSLHERYRSRAHCVRAIAMAAQRLVEQRLLLEEDADRYAALVIRKAVDAEQPGGIACDSKARLP